MTTSPTQFVARRRIEDPHSVQHNRRMRPAVSVVFMVKDEVDRLGPSLASVGWAEEVLVADTGSTDGTVELARAAGARVESIPVGGVRRLAQPGSFSCHARLGARPRRRRAGVAPPGGGGPAGRRVAGRGGGLPDAAPLARRRAADPARRLVARPQAPPRPALTGPARRGGTGSRADRGRRPGAGPFLADPPFPLPRRRRRGPKEHGSTRGSPPSTASIGAPEATSSPSSSVRRWSSSRAGS